MSKYKNIVLAIDPLMDSEKIILKAKEIIASDGVIEMIYVWDEIPISSDHLLPVGQESNEQKNKVKGLLAALAEQYSIPRKNTHVLTGSTSKEIRKFALEHKADCIVIGSHGRHGIALILGSTASSVIHGTPCDILVIKI